MYQPSIPSARQHAQPPVWVATIGRLHQQSPEPCSVLVLFPEGGTPCVQVIVPHRTLARQQIDAVKC